MSRKKARYSRGLVAGKRVIDEVLLGHSGDVLASLKDLSEKAHGPPPDPPPRRHRRKKRGDDEPPPKRPAGAARMIANG